MHLGVGEKRTLHTPRALLVVCLAPLSIAEEATCCSLLSVALYFSPEIH